MPCSPLTTPFSSKAFSITASESENAGFIIFRADAENAEFFEISSYRFNEDLEGLGTSNSGKTYSYLDADLTLKNGQTYYYKVSADNYRGESPLSNEVSATPSGDGIPGFELSTILVATSLAFAIITFSRKRKK